MLLSRWTTESGGDTLTNIHTRLIPGDLGRSRELLMSLDTEAGPWPRDRWWPLRLNQGLDEGSKGGHGPVRYQVASAESHAITFRFADALPFGGWHRFEITGRPVGVEWRHQLHIQDTPLVRTVVLPLHDALLEDLLDSTDALASGAEIRRAPLTLPVRIRRSLAVGLSGRPLP
jgi:hypothetical protein